MRRPLLRALGVSVLSCCHLPNPRRCTGCKTIAFRLTRRIGPQRGGGQLRNQHEMQNGLGREARWSHDHLDDLPRFDLHVAVDATAAAAAPRCSRNPCSAVWLPAHGETNPAARPSSPASIAAPRHSTVVALESGRSMVATTRGLRSHEPDLTAGRGDKMLSVSVMSRLNDRTHPRAKQNLAHLALRT